MKTYNNSEYVKRDIVGTTLRVVEYSIALSFAMSSAISESLRSLLGSAVWTSIPDWLGPTAFSLYVPIVIANVLVLRRSDISRKNVWLFCLTMKFVFLGLFILILAFHPADGLDRSRDLWRAIGILSALLIAAGFASLIVRNNGYRRAYNRFEERFRV